MERSANYLIWYWDGDRFHVRNLGYMTMPGNKIILGDSEYEITDLHWTPKAAPLCVQTVKHLGNAPDWARGKHMGWH